MVWHHVASVRAFSSSQELSLAAVARLFFLASDTDVADIWQIAEDAWCGMK
jgi:hypothetical protein